jgi:hypothetical protein
MVVLNIFLCEYRDRTYSDGSALKGPSSNLYSACPLPMEGPPTEPVAVKK